jgi:hypothetical protein
MEQIEIHSTKDQLRDFKESVLWNDIIRELESWKKGFNDEMLSIVDNAADTNPTSAAILLHMGDLNGRIKAVDYFLSLPDVFLSILSDKSPNLEVSDE